MTGFGSLAFLRDEGESQSQHVARGVVGLQRFSDCEGVADAEFWGVVLPCGGPDSGEGDSADRVGEERWSVGACVRGGKVGCMVPSTWT